MLKADNQILPWLNHWWSYFPQVKYVDVIHEDHGISIKLNTRNGIISSHQKTPLILVTYFASDKVAAGNRPEVSNKVVVVNRCDQSKRAGRVINITKISEAITPEVEGLLLSSIAWISLHEGS